MRILILGAGGVGGYFGARLAAAGVDVSFLVRPGRAAQLARDGLVVLSPLGDLRLRVSTLTEARPGFEVVILACKAYDLDSAIDAVAGAVTADTLLVPLLNGMRQLNILDARFTAERVLGGLCQIGVTLTDKGEVQHLNNVQQFAFGPRLPLQLEGCERLRATLDRGGFNPVLSADIVQRMWEKFVLLAAYAGMTCLMRAPVGAIVAADAGEALMREILTECAAVASACGHAPDPVFIAETLAVLTQRDSPGTASMLRDIQRGARTEHEHILGDMLLRARAAQIAVPLLRVANAHLQAYEFDRSRLHR
ncbi:MAG TPA: 2-dehydropantoate 2-reductase [Steroidobacteraceae bacterium]